MIKLDGREVKVGDRLYSLAYGWGTVTRIDDDYHPICVDFSTKVYEDWFESYTPLGRERDSLPRTLFWDEPKFDPPPPPKRKVKKWQWLYKHKDYKGFLLSTKYYAQRDEFVEEYRLDEVTMLSIIPLEASMIEVEE